MISLGKENIKTKAGRFAFIIMGVKSYLKETNQQLATLNFTKSYQHTQLSGTKSR